MADQEEKLSSGSEESNQQSQMQVSIKMQQGEHTGQPVYSNITAVQPEQGVVFVDFGFLDPQTINLLNRMIQSGEQKQDVQARLSCRMALSFKTAAQLNHQLIQFIQTVNRMQMEQRAVQQSVASDITEPVAVEPASEATPVEPSVEEKPKQKKGFRFPWSSQ